MCYLHDATCLKTGDNSSIFNSLPKSIVGEAYNTEFGLGRDSRFDVDCVTGAVVGRLPLDSREIMGLDISFASNSLDWFPVVCAPNLAEGSLEWPERKLPLWTFCILFPIESENFRRRFGIVEGGIVEILGHAVSVRVGRGSLPGFGTV